MDNATVAANATAAPMALPSVDTGTTFLTTAGYLCLLLGVIYLAYYLLRRFGFQGVLAQGGENAPRLLGRLMLGNRQSVAVVRYKDRELVLGVTDERVTLLAEGEADEDDGASEPKTSFASLLKRGTKNEE